MGCDQSIWSTVSDAIVRSWLWSTATRRSPLGNCNRLLQVVDNWPHILWFSTWGLLAIEDCTFTFLWLNVLLKLEVLIGYIQKNYEKLGWLEEMAPNEEIIIFCIGYISINPFQLASSQQPITGASSHKLWHKNVCPEHNFCSRDAFSFSTVGTEKVINNMQISRFSQHCPPVGQKPKKCNLISFQIIRLITNISWFRLISSLHSL